MKIGIISDTHGSEMRWQLAYDKYLKGCDLIVHAGDVLYNGPRNQVLEDYNPGGLCARINSIPEPMVIAQGNCDSRVDASALDVPSCLPIVFTDVKGVKIVATHGDNLMTDSARNEFISKYKADITISGHTHVTVLEKRNGTTFVNPGSPSLSKREDGRSTVAVYEDATIRIYDIDTDEILMQQEL